MSYIKSFPLCDKKEFSMEYKDPVFELLSSLEHIVFKDDNQKLTSNRKSTVFSEFEQLRKGTGLKIDDFANVMGVSVAMVREWESRRSDRLPPS